MSGTTSNYGFPYPESSDAPDGATQITNLATAVDSELHDHVVEGGAVDSATTAIHHTLGTGSNQAAQGSHTHGTQSLWRAVRAANNTGFLVPVTSGAYWTFGTSTSSNTSDTADLTKWGVAGSNLTVSFVAPPSGKVLVSVGSYIKLYTSTAYIGWIMQEGTSYSGTYNTPTSAEHISSGHEQIGGNGASATDASGLLAGSNPALVDGLTPGSNYCVTMRYSNSDATHRLYVAYRSILVQPQP